MIALAWSTNQLAITARTAAGAVWCTTPREQFMQTLDNMAATPPRHRRVSLKSVVKSLRRDTARPAAYWNAGNDADYMADIALLFAMKLIDGDAVLQGSGIESMKLLISPDTARPWQERGMLDPALGFYDPSKGTVN